MARIELPIEGMTCEHCVRSVRGALEAVPGVRSAEVSLADRKAIVEADGNLPERATLSDAVARAGYRVPDAARPRDSDPQLVSLGTSTLGKGDSPILLRGRSSFRMEGQNWDSPRNSRTAVKRLSYPPARA